MTAQVAADLRAAADVLERDGWAQGSLHPSGRRCVIEAIWEAVGGLLSPRSNKAIRALGEYLEVDRVAGWNDALGRTAAEVIAALRAAADKADQS